MLLSKRRKLYLYASLFTLSLLVVFLYTVNNIYMPPQYVKTTFPKSLFRPSV